MRHRLRDRFRRDHATTGVRRSQRGRERGAVVVEAAIITPLIALLVFGIVEFGLIFKDELTVSSAAGAAARTGAAIPKQPNYQEDMLKELNGRLAGLGLRDGDKVVIYKAEDDGLLKDADSQGEIFDTCENDADANCTAYTWNGTTDQWDAGSADWEPDEQSACRDDSLDPDKDLDRIGVYLDVTHDYITGFVGSGSRSVTQRSVYSLEPLLPDKCEATSP